jgi:hypothetical protein
MDMLDPKRAKERQDVELPSAMKSRTERLLPSLEAPYKLKVDPNRAKLLTDKVDPKWKKSRALTADPATANPNTEIELPNLINDRMENADPK